MESYQNEEKDFKDTLDFIYLRNDIDTGNDLIYKRKTIPMYCYKEHIELNPAFIKNENDIV